MNRPKPDKTPGTLRIFLTLVLILLVLLPSGLSGDLLAVDEMRMIPVNGTPQMLLIRSEDVGHPVLLYLHGGPGDSLIPFAHVATKTLVKTFTVVYWDQRGTGLSYRPDLPRSTMTVRQLIDDTKTVTAYLKSRFHKNSILLLGHSWGSVLGTLVVREDPASYWAYIGVGQVVSQDTLREGRIRWLESVIGRKNTADLDALSQVRQKKATGIGLIRKYGGDLHAISGADVRAIMLASPYKPELYTGDLYEKGEQFSYPLQKEAAKIDFHRDADLQLPVYYFLGRFDFVTPTEPVMDYFRVLKAPAKKVVWFENSSHRMDIEEPVKFQQEIVQILNDHPE